MDNPLFSEGRYVFCYEEPQSTFVAFSAGPRDAVGDSIVAFCIANSASSRPC